MKGVKRGDPATDLVERAIRQWQLRESHSARDGQPENETRPKPARVPQRAGISAAALGWAAGFLGAGASLGFNIAGAWLLGIEPLRLLRIYATVIEGPAALDVSRSDFFLATLILHLATGWLFGVVFAIGARRFCCSGLGRYAVAGAGYGIAIWLVNFYGVLSWLQPLLYGRPFILTEIPIAVAVLTHVSYGLTVALVTHAFQRDFADESLDRLKKEE